MKVRSTRVSLVVLLLNLSACSRLIDGPKVESKPLPSPNPTSYIYDATPQQIHGAVRALYKQQFREGGLNYFHPTFPADEFMTEELKKLFGKPGNENDVYLWYMHSPMGISQVYIVDGKPAPYIADFHLHITEKEPGKTEVEVRTFDSQVIAGRTLLPRRHLTRPNIYVPVSPTTIEEYSLLLKIGRLVGQEGMPALVVPVG